MHALFSNKLYIIPWLGWIPTNACSQIRVSATSADCFVAMLYRENGKISNNMDSFILQQDTPLIMAMMKSKLYIYLAMYVRMYSDFILTVYLSYTYIYYTYSIMNITLIKYSLVCNASKEHCLHLLIEYAAQMQRTTMQYVHKNHKKENWIL